MAYRKKEDWLAEANRLGLDVSDMSWPELQKTVSQALKKEELGIMSAQNEETKVLKQKKRMRADERAYINYVGKTLNISPEMAPERYRLAKYDEDLGSEIEVEEKVFETGSGMTFAANKDLATGTYRITGRSNRRVIATSSVPKENSGMQLYFHDDDDIPVLTMVTDRNGQRKGLLWTHHRLPNVKAALKQMGIFEKYRDEFNASKNPQNVWYASGKQLVVSPGVVFHIFKTEAMKYRKDHGLE